LHFIKRLAYASQIASFNIFSAIYSILFAQLLQHKPVLLKASLKNICINHIFIF